MYRFKNIDTYTPLYYEKQGMLKFKLWFDNRDNYEAKYHRPQRGLFKPRRKEYGHSIELFCGNHYGEVVGSELAHRINMDVCDSELVKVNTEKNKYTSGNIVLKEGCISYSDLKKTEVLIPGNVIIERIKNDRPEEYKELAQDDSLGERDYNNIEIILASIEHMMRSSNCSEQEIKAAKQYIIQMAIYDCVFGNNDRHDENWSFARDIITNSIRPYPAYDNERVLGLYENQEIIRNAISKNNIDEVSKEVLTSRMGIPNNPEKVPYDVLLTYLSEHYPDETLKIMLEILDNVSENDVETILSECEGLPKEYVEFGREMFSQRRKTIENLVHKIINRKKRDEEISL